MEVKRISCECGCDKLPKSGNRFINGHNRPWKGKHRSDSTKRKISESKKGKPCLSSTKFKKGHIPINKGKSSPLKGKKRPPFSDEWKRNMSAGQKGKIGPNRGKQFSKKHKKNLSISHLGLLNYNWCGGISKLPYAFDFNTELKLLIKRRDKYICQLCWKKKIGRNLQIHHIDYDKQNSDPKNLTTLCVSCHIKTNAGRKVWTKWFKSKLILHKRKTKSAAKYKSKCY